MAALLTATKRDKDRTAVYLNECRQMGIEVLVPDVNESGMDFTVHDGRIRFGLSAIRNVGEGVVEKILEARKDGPFEDFNDFIDRVDPIVLNKRTVESLIKAGAFDGLGHPRKGLFLVAENMLDATLERRRNEDMGQFSLFGGEEVAAANGHLEIPDEEWKTKTKLAFEKEMLGLYISDHPLLRARNTLASVAPTSISDLEDMKDRAPVRLGGLVTGITRRWTKNGEPMIFFQLETLEGSVEALCFRTVQESATWWWRTPSSSSTGTSTTGRRDQDRRQGHPRARHPRGPVGALAGAGRAPVARCRQPPQADPLQPSRPGAGVPAHDERERPQGAKLSDQHRVEPRSALFAELKELLGQKAVI